MMRQFSEREKNSLVISVAVLTLGLYYFVVFQPLQNGRADLEQKQTSAFKKLKKEKTQIAESKKLTETYEPYLPMFLQEFSGSEQMSAIVAEIQSIATQLNLHFSEIKPGRVRQQDFLNMFSVSLSTEGRFEELVHFFYLLQNKPHMFRIEELHLEKRSPGDPVLRANLVVSRLLFPSN